MVYVSATYISLVAWKNNNLEYLQQLSLSSKGNISQLARVRD